MITQNIDGLHQTAGSKQVYELHGSIHRNNCTRCGKFYGPEYIFNGEGIPVCENCGAVIKPDVVLYEESLDDAVVDGAIRAISECDTLIIGGTSLNVYPAAGLIQYTRPEIPIYLIDPNPVRTGERVQQIQKGASEGMKELCDLLMK